MPDNEFEKLLPAINEFARRIFIAGVESERRRLATAFQVPLPDYGSGAAQVRAAARALCQSKPEGFAPRDIQGIAGLGVNKSAIRDTLRALIESGDLRQLRRGVYAAAIPE